MTTSPIRVTPEYLASLPLSALRLYQRSGTVTAHQLTEARAWTSSQGSPLQASAGDWWLEDDHSAWTVQPEIFQKTYRATSTPQEYERISLVALIQFSSPFVVTSLEGDSAGQAGDFLAIGLDGDMWALPRHRALSYIPLPLPLPLPTQPDA